jgi:hypothetical protein
LSVRLLEMAAGIALSEFDLDFHRRGLPKAMKQVLKNNPHRCVAINGLLDIDMISNLIFKEVSQRFEI